MKTQQSKFVRSISQASLIPVSAAKNLVEMVLSQPHADHQALQATLLEQAQRYEQQGNKDTATQLHALAAQLRNE